MKRLRARNQNGWLVELNGQYQANWNEYIVDPATGAKKRRHRTELLGAIKSMRKCDAERELKKRVEPMNDSPTVRPDSRVTLNWFLDNKYLPAMKGGWRAGTLSCNLIDIGYLRTSLGELTLEEIDLPKLLTMLEHLARGKKLSESTVKRVRIRAKAIMEYAAELDFIRRNPAQSKYYRMPVCRATAKPVLTKDQISKLWLAVTDVRDRLILMLAGACGIRESEVFGLEWESVFPDHIEIRSTGYRGELQQFQVKRQASHRNVPIPPEIHGQFETWKQVSKSESPLVFPSGRTGGVIWPWSWLFKRIKPVAKTVGIKNVNFRLLRRSFATWNQEQLKAAQTVMGHSSIEVTANVYAQSVDANAVELVNKYYREIVSQNPPETAARVQ